MKKSNILCVADAGSYLQCPCAGGAYGHGGSKPQRQSASDQNLYSIPEQDPAALIEEPFELEGYLYTFADIVKSENPVEENTDSYRGSSQLKQQKMTLLSILEQLQAHHRI